MADKPSRALVLYGYGLARFISPSHDHLHSLASKASCGSVHGNEAVVITKNSTLKVFGAKLGLIVLESNDLVKNLHSLAKVPADVVASELLNLLGFKEGKTLETSEYNLVCVYYVNALVGDIMKIAQPGSEIGSRLHLSLVMSYGHVPEDNDPNLPVLTTKDEKKSDLLMLWSLLVSTLDLETDHKVCIYNSIQRERERCVVLIINVIHLENVICIHWHSADLSKTIDPLRKPHKPRHIAQWPIPQEVFQAKDPSLMSSSTWTVSFSDGICLNISHKCYTMRGENQREDVRHHFPILITQWQYGVTRKDMAEMFSFKDFLEHGGNLAIPADRFLHEVAFKIWKAPKYGA
ncbi:uncharacterized protein LOC122296603 [Carya illinoinensis]|uniref:uncharacterized protein LOC122296603 n=1 Tax=Carya illinoinensis TaxID=32201 RepID=UPI001C72731D|nr:uncharacterized protein LOC122296603 [Carya illinoinensis]